MSRIPIEIRKFTTTQKFNNTEQTVFQLAIKDKSTNWEQTYNCTINELKKFRDEIDLVIGELELHEKLGIQKDLAIRIEKANQSDSVCKQCNYHSSAHCVTCINILHSSLERKLFSKFIERKFYFEPQYPMNVFGKRASIVNADAKNLKEKYKDLLTQVDFYIPDNKTPICVYTDGHIYHERTEEQAKRDRGIDRKLQEIGFIVFRYTGKDVDENMNRIIYQIEKVLNN